MLWIQSDSEWWAESIVNIHCHKKDIWRSEGDSAMSKIKVEEDGRMFKTKTWINESEQDTRSYQEFEGRTRYESLWREMEPYSVFCYVFLCYVAQIRRWYIFSKCICMYAFERVHFSVPCFYISPLFVVTYFYDIYCCWSVLITEIKWEPHASQVTEWRVCLFGLISSVAFFSD